MYTTRRAYPPPAISPSQWDFNVADLQSFSLYVGPKGAWLVSRVRGWCQGCVVGVLSRAPSLVAKSVCDVSWPQATWPSAQATTTRHPLPRSTRMPWQSSPSSTSPRMMCRCCSSNRSGRKAPGSRNFPRLGMCVAPRSRAWTPYKCFCVKLRQWQQTNRLPRQREMKTSPQTYWPQVPLSERTKLSFMKMFCSEYLKKLNLYDGVV